LKREIQMSEILEISGALDMRDMGGNMYGFQIQTTTQLYELCTESQGCRVEWLAALKKTHGAYLMSKTQRK